MASLHFFGGGFFNVKCKMLGARVGGRKLGSVYLKKKDLGQKQRTGKKGEELAVNFLEKKGFLILETNWRFSRAEVDIIAQDGEELVFIEVKTRTSKNISPPEASVTRKKRAFLVEAAGAYMEQINYDWEIRFDIITVLLWSDQQFEITHFQDAFFPGW